MKNSKFNQLKRGFSKRCPKCGKSPIFLTYIKTLDYCKSCGIKFSDYKSDDGPAIVPFSGWSFFNSFNFNREKI